MSEFRKFIPKEVLESVEGEEKAFDDIDQDETLIRVRRHGGPYDNRSPREIQDDDERAKLGLLTEQGIKDTTESAEAMVNTMDLSGDKYVAVFVSPTHWWGIPDLGQRAVHTGEIHAQAILEGLKEKGLSEDHLLNNVGFKRRKEGQIVRDEASIGEWNGFDSLEMMQLMRAEYPEHKELLDAVSSDALEEERKKLGVETSEDMAKTFEHFLQVLERFASWWHKANKGKKLELVVISHSERERSWAQEKFGLDYNPAYNEEVDVKIAKDGKSKARMRGQEFEAK